MTGLALYTLALCTTVGNALVIHAIRTEKRLQTVSISGRKQNSKVSLGQGIHGSGSLAIVLSDLLRDPSVTNQQQ